MRAGEEELVINREKEEGDDKSVPAIVCGVKLPKDPDQIYSTREC